VGVFCTESDQLPLSSAAPVVRASVALPHCDRVFRRTTAVRLGRIAEPDFTVATRCLLARNRYHKRLTHGKGWAFARGDLRFGTARPCANRRRSSSRGGRMTAASGRHIMASCPGDGQRPQPRRRHYAYPKGGGNGSSTAIFPLAPGSGARRHGMVATGQLRAAGPVRHSARATADRVPAAAGTTG
jgi:hypothetical protein